MANVLYIGCDMTETITGLTGGGAYLNAATVTYALKDGAGNTVTGGTGSYSYTAASNGNYTATIESTVTTLCVDGVRYWLEVTMTSGGYNGFWRIPRFAQYKS